MKNFLKLILLIFISFFLLWMGGLLWFKGQIPEVQESGDKKTDAIVVLTGGSDRLNEGVRLLQENLADKLFVSGVGKGVLVKELFRENNLPNSFANKLESKIELGRKAGSTRGNAFETEEWVSKNNFKSLRLVTSNYHMPRSLLEFKITMPEVEVIPHSVFPKHVKLDGWWKYPGTRDLIISEYNKYLATSVAMEVERRTQ